MRNDELLCDIPEEEQSKEEEEIEVIDCPGIDGARQNKFSGARMHPMM